MRPRCLRLAREPGGGRSSVPRGITPGLARDTPPLRTPEVQRSGAFAGGGFAHLPAVDRDRYQQRLNLPLRDVTGYRVAEDRFECVPVSHVMPTSSVIARTLPATLGAFAASGGRRGMRVRIRPRATSSVGEFGDPPWANSADPP